SITVSGNAASVIRPTRWMTRGNFEPVSTTTFSSCVIAVVLQSSVGCVCAAGATTSDLPVVLARTVTEPMVTRRHPATANAIWLLVLMLPFSADKLVLFG